jgi:hypothetical protein
MNARAVPAELRAAVAVAARHCCGYCRTSELITGNPLEIEHLVPRSRGGLTVVENLWLACRLCNAHKSDRTHIRDPETGTLVRMFDPRRDAWHSHFRWSGDALLIEGLTPIGRAMVEALDLNRDSLLVARPLWIVAGWHPPAD